MSDNANPGLLVVDSVERCLDLGRARGVAWTLRQIAGLVAEVTYYAEQVGSLI